jgi:predicted PurR-regulated permease PerM
MSLRNPAPQMNPASEQPPFTRDRLLTIVLIIVTAVGMVACIVIAAPFVPALTWAVALAVVAYPVHDWMVRRIHRAGLAAGLAVSVITIGLLVPTVFVARQVGQKATEGFKRVQKSIDSGELASRLEQNPRTAAIARWVRSNVDIAKEVSELSEAFRQHLGRMGARNGLDGNAASDHNLSSILFVPGSEGGDWRGLFVCAVIQSRGR